MKAIFSILFLMGVNLLGKHFEPAGTQNIVNSYEYGPFGQVISKSKTVSNSFQYNSKYLDEKTGLPYYGYRIYDSEISRNF